MAYFDPLDSYQSGRQYGSSDSSPYTSGTDYRELFEKEAGWDLEFVPKRSDKYDCPICLLVLREPVQTECGHRFCKGCIHKWLRESDSRCPVDNQPLNESQLFPDNFAKREILALTVKCPNSKTGCDQNVVLKHLQNHVESCLFGLTPCPNDCPNVILRGQLSQHLQVECSKRQIKCLQCSGDVRADHLNNHLLCCPEGSMSCPNCDISVTRSKLSSHLLTECEKTSVKCQYHFLGCKFEGERSSLRDHDTEALQEHMSLINKSLILILSMLGISPNENQNIHRPSSMGHQPNEGTVSTHPAHSFPSYFGAAIDQNSQLSLISQIMNKMQISGTPGQNLPSVVSGPPALNQLNRSHSHPSSQMNIPNIQNIQDESTEGRQSEGDTQTGAAAELYHSSNPSADNMCFEMLPSHFNASQFQSIKTQNDMQDESLARHDQKLIELIQVKEHQEKVIRDLKTKVKTLEGTVADFEGRQGGGLYVWKIKNYLKLRRDAERGETTAIHSSSFYSSFYGYKLCIRVNLNGVDTAKGTHLSLFIHFMQGEYDELLEWPFSGRIVLTVIDQNPICELRNHISETLMSKPNLAAFQRPVTHRNHKGFGYMEFLPLSVIDGSTYVRNDTLIIKANIIPNNAYI